MGLVLDVWLMGSVLRMGLEEVMVVFEVRGCGGGGSWCGWIVLG